jgi:hypothetical protein
VKLSTDEGQHAASVIDRDLISAVGDPETSRDFTSRLFDAAEILEGALPERARLAFAELRRGTISAVRLQGLPSDPEPGPTPTEPGETSFGLRRGQAWVAIAVRKLGDEFGYAREKEGAVVHNIYPTRRGAETQSNAAFKVPLSLHTENAFHPIRPNWIVLYCVRTPPNPPATKLVVLDSVLEQLTDAEIDVLRQPRFDFPVVDSHLTEGEAEIALRVAPLSGSPRRPKIRWHEALRPVDEIAKHTAETFTATALRTTENFKLEAGDLLAFANDWCLHGRDQFDAALDGRDRWLLRGYAIRDVTQTTAFVSPQKPRVTRIDLSQYAAE